MDVKTYIRAVLRHGTKLRLAIMLQNMNGV